MARQRRSEKLDTRTSRLELTPSAKPYTHRIYSGLLLCYRRNKKTPGVWIARKKLVGEKKYEEIRLGIADDFDDMTEENQSRILDFKTAQNKTIALTQLYDKKPTSQYVFYTVEDALSDYLEWYSSDREVSKAKPQLSKIRLISAAPEFKNKPISELTTEDIQKWMYRISKEPTRRAHGRGSVNIKTDKIPKTGTSEHELFLRRRRSSANNYLSTLKAALNRAFNSGKVENSSAWDRVKPFRGVSEAKIRFLTLEEVSRLLRNCPPAFGALVEGALHTGARYGELTSLMVEDYFSDLRVVRFPGPITKSKKTRTIPLTVQGTAFFDSLAVGKKSKDLLFVKRNGERWVRSEQGPHMRRACKDAKIAPAISFHILRHTVGSLLAQKGVPLQVIATMLGHADTRITQKHYAHLCPDFVAQVIRENLPEFGAIPIKVVPILRRKHG